MNPKLYILVENFSDVSRESFFEKELPYLSAAFKEVVVIPLYPDNSILSFSAPNVRVEQFDFFQPVNRIKFLLAHFFTVLSIYSFEIIKTHNRRFYITNFRACINDLILKMAAAKNLEALIKKDINADTVFYSYWFMQWVMALSIIKLKYPKLKIISRVHGADYDEGQVKRTLPFRYFQLSKVNKIIPVSAYAKHYLETKFKVPPAKIEVSRLGLLINGQPGPVNADALHIVSCSSLIPLKRVALIADILSHITVPAKWTHFGDGPLADALKQKVKGLGGHILVDFKGYVSNKAFLAYLENTAISVFINVSESEGIPVTMMEAIASGVPLIGTDVCGVPEIVTPQTGFLIPVNFDPKTVAEMITREHEKKKIYSAAFRKSITDFYMNYFKDEINHKQLSAKILSVCAA